MARFSPRQAAVLKALEANKPLNALNGSLWLVYCEMHLDGCIMSFEALEAYKRQNGAYEAITTCEVTPSMATVLAGMRNLPRLGT